MSDPYSNLIVGKLKLKGMPIKKKWVNRRKSIGRSKKVHKKKETAEAPQVLEEVPVEEMGSVPTMLSREVVVFIVPVCFAWIPLTHRPHCVWKRHQVLD